MEISFSQAQTWKTCSRSWAYKYVNGYIGLPSIPSILGSRYHSEIEECLLQGMDSGNEYVQNAIDVVDALEFDHAYPEMYLEDIRDGIKVRGYADVIGKKDDNYWVIDWKFPGKSPGSKPKKDHVDQVQLYAYLLGESDTTCVVAYPSHEKAFCLEADLVRGREVLDDIYEVGREIIDSGALKIKGEDQEPTYNYLCGAYCGFRDRCPMGGNHG